MPWQPPQLRLPLPLSLKQHHLHLVLEGVPRQQPLQKLLRRNQRRRNRHPSPPTEGTLRQPPPLLLLAHQNRQNRGNRRLSPLLENAPLGLPKNPVERHPEVESAVETALLESLLKPEAYPHKPQRVEMEQTHISWVFLTGDTVYKIKKPVNFGFLDFSTLEKRHFYCQEEVRLNKRLSPEIYLGVAPIVKAGNALVMEAEGQPVEYAVKMKQLPREKIMKALLIQDKVEQKDVVRLAEIIAAFHAKAASSPEITREGGMDSTRQNIEDNFSQTEKYIGISISRQHYQETRDHALSFMKEKASLFQQRIAQGHIRDCHGDLHSGQIFITNSIHILDCIEFNNRFRYIDVASDIAFLAMDLDLYGRPDLSMLLIDHYLEKTHDEEVRQLLPFYKSYRAYVRGKVTSFRLDEPAIPEQEKRELVFTAKRYFNLAHGYAVNKRQPTLFITFGLAGTGKSTTSEELRQKTGAALISSDVVRKSLARIPLTERRPEAFSQGIYSQEFTRKTYDALFQQADRWLRVGRSVILDASFIKAEERQRAQETAQKANAQFTVVECRSKEAALRGRLEERTARGDSPSDGRWEIYLAQKQRVEPIAEAVSPRHWVIDNSGSLENTAQQLQERLEEYFL